MREKKKEWALLLCISIILLIWKFAFHELWKDEWQAWLVARDQNIIELFSFLNYEGHPSLWYLWLKPFTYLSNVCQEDFLIKIAHSLPLLFVLYLLFLKFNIPIIHKILASLSYFLFFEYGVVCRGYVMVVALCFLVVYSIKKDRKLLTACGLFLLCQSEVYGVMIGALLIFYQYLNLRKLKEISIPLICYIAGAIFFILSVFPRGNKDDFSRAYNKEKFSMTILKESIQGNLGNVFGIGLIEDTAANSSSGEGLILSMLIFLCSIYIFKEDKMVLKIWLTGLLGFLLFGVLIYTGGVRQWGMVFLLFVCMLELKQEKAYNKIIFGLIILMMTLPLYHNIRAVFFEYKLPFTNAVEAGNFIKEKIPANVPIVSLNKFETANAAAYAGRKFYELPLGNEFTYFKWLEKVYLPTQTELILFTKFKKTKGIIIISSKPVDDKRFPFLQFWKSFNSESIKQENYYFYVLNMEQLGGNVQ